MPYEETILESAQRKFEEVPPELKDLFMGLVMEGRKFDRIYGGASYRNDENPEKLVHKFLKDSGIETVYDEKGTRENDAQSESPVEVCCEEDICSQKPAQPAVPATSEDCWFLARNNEIATNDRVRALQECLLDDNSRTADTIVDELCGGNVPDEWRDALVYAAENVHFKDPEQQTRLRLRLRELALELREVSQAGTEHVVWSAMRRFSSLTPPEEANDLLEFLDRKGVVDTRMVALQCVVRMFESGPPSDSEMFESLARRVEEYAHKFLDPDVFAGGENSSIARNAVLALAALGSPSLEECLTRVKALGRRWLSRRVRQQLNELLQSWESDNLECKGSAAFKVVQAAIKTIQTSETS